MPQESEPPKSLKPRELESMVRLRSLPRVQWRRLTLAFDRDRAVFEILFQPQAKFSKRPIRDPFVAALRRLCNDATSLPLRHRQALRQLDRPLALARLALEEANTRAWQKLDDGPLRKIAAWLARHPLGDGAASADLHQRAATYLAAYLPREGNRVETFRAVSAMLLPERAPDDPALALLQLHASALAWGLDHPKSGATVQSALLGAELHLGQLALDLDPDLQAALPELLAEHALVRGAILGLYGKYPDAERGHRDALADLPPASDPFLRLMLLLEAAGAAVHAALAFLEVDRDEVFHTLDTGGEALSHEDAATLARRILEGLDAQRPTFARAAEWLDQAAPLLPRHGNAEQHLRHRWLSAWTRQWEMPEQSFRELIALFRQAKARGKSAWQLSLAGDLLLFFPRLREIEENRRGKLLLDFAPLVQDLLSVFDDAIAGGSGDRLLASGGPEE